MKKEKNTKLFGTFLQNANGLDESESEEQEEETRSLSSIRQIVETGSITVEKDGHFIHCLTIIGQIEGHYILPPQNKTTKYEHVIPQLVAIEESDEIEGLIVILNTVGGDIEAGLAIAELISGMQTPTVSLAKAGGARLAKATALSKLKCTFWRMFMCRVMCAKAHGLTAKRSR